MRIRALRQFARLGVFAMIGASLSGCFLQQVMGNVQVHSGITPELRDIVANSSAIVDGGFCQTNYEPENVRYVTCSYFIDGEPISSTVDLVGAFGLYGVLIDPLILEVPSDVISITSTYDTGSGAQPLPVGQAGSFPVNPGLRITAEVGMTFLFLDMPGEVVAALPGDPNQGTNLSFSLSYHRLIPPGPIPPTTIKPMVAGTLVVQHQNYYVPLLPCVTDFADVPAITLPQSNTPQHLEMTLGDLIRNHDASPCNHVVHDFSGALPPPGLIFAPLVRR
jgi:hypothetical protein